MSIDRVDATCAMNALGQLGAVRADLSSLALHDCIGRGTYSKVFHASTVMSTPNGIDDDFQRILAVEVFRLREEKSGAAPQP